MKQYTKDLGRVALVAEGVWSDNKAYDKLSIVYNKCDKFAYVSRKEVPVGVDIDNKEYWQPLNVNGYADNNFINLTKADENNQITGYDNIVEAATSVSVYNRRVGAVLSFYNINSDRLDRQPEFELWQFNSTDINNWTKESAWQNIYYNWNIFVGWYLGLDALKNHVSEPTVGQYAYIGTTLNDALLVQCRTNKIWTVTDTKVRDYISVKVEGNITIGDNGNWFNDGKDTGIPATPSVDEEIDSIVSQIKTLKTTTENLHTEDVRIEEQLNTNVENLQKQISSNDSDINNLNKNHNSLKTTIDSIAVTGGASVASAVTYDNTISGMTAMNVQGAIDDIHSDVEKHNSVLNDKIISLNFTKSYQYIQINVEAGRKVINLGDFTVYLHKEVDNITDRIVLPKGEEIYLEMDIAAVRCASNFGETSIAIEKKYAEQKEIDSISQEISFINGYSLEISGTSESQHTLNLVIPKGTQVQNIGDITFVLHGENYKEESLVLKGNNTYKSLPFNATILTFGTNMEGTAKLLVVPKYVTVNDFAEYKSKILQVESNCYQFTITKAYEYFDLEFPINKGSKVSNIGDIAYCLYDDSDNRVTLRPNETQYITITATRFRAASYTGDAKLKVFPVSDNIEKVAYQFDEKVLNIGYSALDDDIAPVNTISHYKYVIEKGFNSVKADMRLTKDNKIVLCHDEGFTFDSDGRIISFDENNNTSIRDLNLEDILNLEHSRFYDTLGFYEHPTDLNSFLVLCKLYGVIPFITIRNEYVNDTIEALLPILKKYNFLEKCLINVNPPNVNTAYIIRTYLPHICICYTLNSANLITKEEIDKVYSMGNAVLCANTNSLDSVDESTLHYARELGVRIFGWFVSDKETYQKYVANGFCGFQITSSKVITDYKLYE